MYCDELRIRRTKTADLPAVATVQAEAFGRPAEAELTIRLIKSSVPTISLLAADAADLPVGHLLLSEIEAPLPSVALAPLGVIPQYRELQIGSSLVREGLRQAAKAGYRAVFVLGEPAYYERFGFSTARARPFEVPWPGSHFMALELIGGALDAAAGRLVYPAAFFD